MFDSLGEPFKAWVLLLYTPPHSLLHLQVSRIREEEVVAARRAEVRKQQAETQVY